MSRLLQSICYQNKPSLLLFDSRYELFCLNTKQSLPTALSACHTSVPNAFQHHQASFLFAEKDLYILSNHILSSAEETGCEMTTKPTVERKHVDLQDLLQRADSAAPNCQRWFWGPCAPMGSLSAPLSLLAAAGGAEQQTHTNEKRKKKLMPFLTSALLLRIPVTAPSLETNLYVWLLRGSRWDLGVVVWLWGLHWETHHRSSDGGWWSVVIRELYTENGSTWLLSKARGQCLNLIPRNMPFNLFSSAAKSEM